MAEQRSKSRRLRVPQHKERVVLTELRRLGQASKNDLVEATGLPAQTIVDIVNALSRDGLARRVGRRLGRVGQPSLLYGIDPDGVFGLGLHVRRDAHELALVDFEGRIRGRLASGREPPRLDRVLQFLATGVPSLTKGIPAARVSGLGVALSHDLWYRPDRQGLPPEIVAAWDGREVTGEIGAAAGLPVFVENDARAAAVAEYLLGGAQAFTNFLYVTVGVHIAGALVLGGSLMTGTHGNAATLGAIPVGPSRLASAASQRQAPESLGNRASLAGLMRYLQLHGFTIRAVSELPEVVDQARGLVQAWLDDCVDALVEGFTACFAVVDVEAVLVDSLLPQFMIMEIVERVDRRLRAGALPGLVVPRLIMGTLGGDAAVLGSAILPISARFLSEREAPRRHVEKAKHGPSSRHKLKTGKGRHR